MIDVPLLTMFSPRHDHQMLGTETFTQDLLSQRKAALNWSSSQLVDIYTFHLNYSCERSLGFIKKFLIPQNGCVVV